MPPKHIRSKDIAVKDFGTFKVQSLFNDPDYEKFSITKIDTLGEQKWGLDTASDRAYFVLEGEGTCFLENKKFTLEKGDVVFIPKNTKYKNSGNLTLISISSPKFDSSKRKTYE